MTPRNEKVKGTLLMVSAMVILSPDALLISLISVDPWTLVFWRGLLTACTLSVTLVCSHGKGVLREVFRMGPAGILAGFLFSASTVSFVMSIRLTTAANTLVIVAGTPLFAAILTRIFLAERVPVRTWVAVIAGFSGIIVIFSGSLSTGSALGDLLALATALIMATNFVIIRSHRKVSMIPAVVLSGILTTLLTLFMADPLSVGASDFLLLAVLGSVVMPIPLAIFTVAPKLIPAAEVSLIMLLETFLGPLWVWLVIGQRPAGETVLGGGLLVTTLVVHALVGRGRDS
ncbi:DMT family transporter [bacterium]|nr:DMT family transporter [bacterium]